MSSSEENDREMKVTGFTMRNIDNGEQRLISFRAESESDENNVQRIYKLIVGKVLNGRDTIIVTKDDQLIDLISTTVGPADRDYVGANALALGSFPIEPYRNVRYYATLVKNLPLSVAEDLANSVEFTYGNLWFLVTPKDADINGFQLVFDIHKLTSYTDAKLPILFHEAIDSSAIHDGLDIFWFKPNEDVYENVIKPLFDN